MLTIFIQFLVIFNYKNVNGFLKHRMVVEVHASEIGIKVIRTQKMAEKHCTKES